MIETVIVLLVDDQAVIGEAVRRMLLDQPDIQFNLCVSASEAVAAAQRIMPTVILQDLIMPGIDGMTLLSRYRATPALKDTPIIVLSSKEDPAIKRDAFLGGANDYLVKLPDKIELIARVRLHSRAYLNGLQRDVAYRHLDESQRQLVAANAAMAEHVAELQVARDELSRMVSTDALTGLLSRHRWLELAALEFERYRRYRRPFTFLMADLDSFKRINDTFGHQAGDDVIRRFADVLRLASRQSDVAGRLGGEEFGVLLTETPEDKAREAAQRIVTMCRTIRVPAPEGNVTFTCSIGLAEATMDDATVHNILRRADEALHDAKSHGRDRWWPEAELQAVT